MSTAFINGNKHDIGKPIPYTRECYWQVCDANYPIPMEWDGNRLVYDTELRAVIVDGIIQSAHREAAERLKDRPIPWHR